MITWPISFAPFAREVAHLPARRALQVGAAVGAGVFALARAASSAARRRSRAPGWPSRAGRGRGVRRLEPGRAFPSSSTPWSSCPRCRYRACLPAGHRPCTAAAAACGQRRGGRPEHEHARKDGQDAAQQGRLTRATGSRAVPSFSRRRDRNARARSARCPLSPIGQARVGQLDAAEHERPERVGMRAASRDCRRRRAPGDPSR